MSFPNIRLFLYFSCFTVRWLFCFMFFFSMFEKDRTHTLTHLGGNLLFRQGFPCLPTYYYYSYYSYQGGKRDWNWTATTLFFVFFIMSYVCVFTTVGEKNTVSCAWAGFLGWAWFGFDTFVYFFFPSFFYTFTSYFTLLYLSCLDARRDEHGLLSDSSACCGSVDESKRTCFFYLYIFNFVPGGEVGWLVNGCLYFFFSVFFFFLFPFLENRIGSDRLLYWLVQALGGRV